MIELRTLFVFKIPTIVWCAYGKGCVKIKKPFDWFSSCGCCISRALQWRHNASDSVSNHQPRDCLFNRLFGGRSKKTSKFRVTGLCADSPHKWPVTRKMFPFDDVIMGNARYASSSTIHVGKRIRARFGRKDLVRSPLPLREKKYIGDVVWRHLYLEIIC